MLITKSSVIWARSGQVLRHDIGKLQHKATFMTSCIVTNEIAKTPQKEEEKDDVNPFDEWKSKFFQAIFSPMVLLIFKFCRYWK